MGMYNHSTSSSAYSIISGRNNFNASYNSFINGTFNNVPYTYLGHKTVFGNGNVVNGSVGLTSGVALLNKSFGTTVIGKLTRITPILNKVLILKQPHFLLLVTECKRSVWEMVCIHQKQRVGTIEKWFDDFAKCN
jgi:hypothetical protein